MCIRDRGERLPPGAEGNGHPWLASSCERRISYAAGCVVNAHADANVDQTDDDHRRYCRTGRRQVRSPCRQLLLIKLGTCQHRKVNVPFSRSHDEVLARRASALVMHSLHSRYYTSSLVIQSPAPELFLLTLTPTLTLPITLNLVVNSGASEFLTDKLY